MADNTGERLQKILSAHGVASRRSAEKMILDGRVTVNGITAVLGGSAVDGRDDIRVDGVPLMPVEKPVYIMLNKPRGYVTTMKDERGRRTVTELVSEAGTRVYPIGRLDMDSEGLLLMTNDGLFANKVMHPSGNMTKTYQVHVRGDVDNAADLLLRPIELDGRTIQAVSVSVKKKLDDSAVLYLEIAEGLNKQVRRMCEQCGLAVVLLKRVSIGSLRIGSLRTGQWRYLTKEEVSYVNGSTDKPPRVQK